MTVRGTVRGPGGTPPLRVDDQGMCVQETRRKSRVGEAPYSSVGVKDPPKMREISHWIKYHQAAYQHASDLGSLPMQQHESHFQSIVNGELEETTYWEGRMSGESERNSR